MLGIVLDWTDRPIASFLVPANTADVTLLLPWSSACAACSCCANTKIATLQVVLR